MYPSIDEAHVLLVLISTTDFQSVSFGTIRKEHKPHNYSPD